MVSSCILGFKDVLLDFRATVPWSSNVTGMVILCLEMVLHPLPEFRVVGLSTISCLFYFLSTVFVYLNEIGVPFFITLVWLVNGYLLRRETIGGQGHVSLLTSLIST